MKIELTKSVHIQNGMGPGTVGEEQPTWWVRAREDNANGHEIQVIGEPFQKEADAKAYYDGCIAVYKKYGKFKPEPILVSSENL